MGVELPSDAEIVVRLRASDEKLFALLVDQWSGGMVRVALTYVPNREAAEDVVQETWLAVLSGLDGFAGRSSLRTWIHAILINKAKTLGIKESRTLPVADTAAPAVNPLAFQNSAEPHPGHWRQAPAAWPSPESKAEEGELVRHLDDAITELPPRQRQVLVLRDVQGFTAHEVSAAMDISLANQRVLLHRARSAVRARLATYLTPERGAAR
uniref:RNA polymerase sigma factor n=1 Tax=Paractinoplanes polyasparticus TaxID=2856853 RepID=UPI002107B8FC|nr:sigma-70 family RNA polymerase sigma factor [Actinoplanes polyasparticus]